MRQAEPVQGRDPEADAGQPQCAIRTTAGKLWSLDEANPENRREPGEWPRAQRRQRGKQQTAAPERRPERAREPGRRGRCLRGNRRVARTEPMTRWQITGRFELRHCENQG